jgi:hypothetical protein
MPCSGIDEIEKAICTDNESRALIKNDRMVAPNISRLSAFEFIDCVVDFGCTDIDIFATKVVEYQVINNTPLGAVTLLSL